MNTGHPRSTWQYGDPWIHSESEEIIRDTGGRPAGVVLPEEHSLPNRWHNRGEIWHVGSLVEERASLAGRQSS